MREFKNVCFLNRKRWILNLGLYGFSSCLRSERKLDDAVRTLPREITTSLKLAGVRRCCWRPIDSRLKDMEWNDIRLVAQIIHFVYFIGLGMIYRCLSVSLLYTTLFHRFW